MFFFFFLLLISFIFALLAAFYATVSISFISSIRFFRLPGRWITMHSATSIVVNVYVFVEFWKFEYAYIKEYNFSQLIPLIWSIFLSHFTFGCSAYMICISMMRCYLNGMACIQLTGFATDIWPYEKKKRIRLHIQHFSCIFEEEEKKKPRFLCHEKSKRMK